MIHRDDGFGRRWSVAQGAVGPDCVVVDAPLLDQNLSFAQVVEDFTVEQLIPEPAIEAFTVSVLPRASWFNVGCLGPDIGPDSGNPIPDGLGNKFRPVV